MRMKNSIHLSREIRKVNRNKNKQKLVNKSKCQKTMSLKQLKTKLYKKLNLRRRVQLNLWSQRRKNHRNQTIIMMKRNMMSLRKKKLSKIVL